MFPSWCVKAPEGIGQQFVGQLENYTVVSGNRPVWAAEKAAHLALVSRESIL